MSQKKLFQANLPVLGLCKGLKLLEHFGGYTIQEANGGWIDGDIIYQEYTIVIYLSDTTLEEVHSAGQDLINKFNQSLLLIQSNKTTTDFYSEN